MLLVAILISTYIQLTYSETARLNFESTFSNKCTAKYDSYVWKLRSLDHHRSIGSFLNRIKT